jgi:hypothetical protein
MIKQYGDGAEIEVVMRVDEMLRRGDFGGRGVWRRVLAAVRQPTVKTAIGSMH